ncbi:hypothetical protein BSZ39_07580 [Bowdeniella nasicola]|uniref:Uncharacterized protein n=1 Tax=Bowdeniella nasicola TaxID=208480 RepID=A0A1Q5Q1Q7_9ACTO|nr:hypothetical protein [Bowdeniella nasicola]OKL53778.1 hypothetical protein BSZ39_07580 [Bowdeniella nasicola]
MFQAIAQMEEEDADKVKVEPEECKSLPSIVNLDDAEAEQVAQAITPGLEVMILAMDKDAMSYDLGKLKEHRDKCGTSTRSMGERKETETLTPVDFDVDAGEVQAYKFLTTGGEEDYEAISVSIMKGDTYLAFDLSETTDEALGKLEELVNEVLGRLN